MGIWTSFISYSIQNHLLYKTLHTGEKSLSIIKSLNENFKLFKRYSIQTQYSAVGNTFKKKIAMLICLSYTSTNPSQALKQTFNF